MDEITKRRYILISKTQEYADKLDEAQHVLKYVCKTYKNPAVSFSYGKDSLVCVDIARHIKPDILILNIDRGAGGDIPDAVEMYDTFAKDNQLNFKRVKTPESIIGIYKQYSSLHEYVKSQLTRNLLKGIKKAVNDNNIDCSILGLRTEESAGRRRLSKLGLVYQTKSGIAHCYPVLNWAGSEIWAYIISNNLPYLRWYDFDAEFEGYENARYSNWAGLFMSETGRIVRLKKNYPELYNQLVVQFPEITEFV